MDRRLGREEGRPYKTWLPVGRVGRAGPGPARTAGFCVQRHLPQDELGTQHGLWVQAGKLKVRKRTPLGHGQAGVFISISVCRDQRLQKSMAGEGWTFRWPRCGSSFAFQTTDG